jgi:uncharacterized protein YjiK
MTISSRIIVGLFFTGLLVGCQPNSQNNNQNKTESVSKTYVYDFAKPTQKYELPKVLREVSGLSFYKENQLLCVQDEKGEVFVYDLEEQKVTETHRFDQPGDYEGVELVGDEVYVLRSDGKLLNFKMGDSETREIETDLPGKNDVEGLTYDATTQRLWLAVKESTKKGNKEDNKLIYSFDLRRRAVYKERELKEKKWETLGLKGKEWQDFKPSGIAFHPKTGEVYLLSSAGHRLIIFHREGGPLQNIPLNPTIFRQPEGICFAPDGTLYIASEGDGGNGYVLKFDAVAQ